MGLSMFFSSENDVIHHHSSPYASVDCTLSLELPPLASATMTMTKAGGGGGNNLGARRCANCDTTSTPLWRNGPSGPKSLCNACGIRFKKEERRATAAGNSTSGGGLTAFGVPASDHHGGADYYYNNNSNNNHYYASSSPWTHHQQQNTQRVPHYSPANNNEYSFVDDVRESHDITTDPFLSWRLNVADRTRLVHDCTM
ncbi:hypothetical protein IGI04_000209 [Brassica rapa subsp. trilocularis]|uniref:GATA-type domain-containing protein n=1 Tax=Brassica rapa subsp. trilocularis TaxID=1813537 RepID=A0ABQ7NP42_BRACM|nr:hypothetical protein IGI04_000209 [Brassica rapa subsp. trilocularis]